MTDTSAGDATVRSPGDYIRDELKARDWTQGDLAKILDRPLPTVNRILQGKHAILPEMAIALGIAFGTPASLWMMRESEYRLSLAEKPTADVSRMAKLYELAPVSELQKRGWIRPGNDPDDIERDILGLLEINDLNEQPHLLGPMRKSGVDVSLTPAQRAWCFRVKQIAKLVPVRPYRPEKLPECERALRKLAAYSQEVAKVADVFASFGIRFVVVEPLAGSKVDGLAIWLDAERVEAPVIGLSLRYDRIDAFWFTVMHELSHIRHRDEAIVDSELGDPKAILLDVKPPIERRADEESSAALIKSDDLTSFVRRVGPLYSKQAIVQFAHTVKIHPGIIVGQLQHRGEIGYRNNREYLLKVREKVIETALTDGWGHSIESGVHG